MDVVVDWVLSPTPKSHAYSSECQNRPCLTMVLWKYQVFTARRYASAVLAVIVCPSVCLSVCPSVCQKSELYKDG